MLVTGSFLPASNQLVPESDARQRRPPAEQPRNDLQSHRRRPTVEYIHHADVEYDSVNTESGRVPNYEHIDPANRSAILKYSDTAGTSITEPQRVGRLLDIFL